MTPDEYAAFRQEINELRIKFETLLVGLLKAEKLKGASK